MMKKMIAALFLVAVTATAGCADTSQVRRDTSTQVVSSSQQSGAKVQYLSAAKYNHAPGDVAGKCNCTTLQVVKYIGSDADRTPPPANHPVWAYVNSLNCAGNSDENGYYKLFCAKDCALDTTATTAVVSASSTETTTTTVHSGPMKKGITYQRLYDPSKGRGEYAGKLYCSRNNTWERQIMQYNSDPKPQANHPIFAYVDQLEPSSANCQKGEQEAYMLFPAVAVDTPVPNPVPFAQVAATAVSASASASATAAPGTVQATAKAEIPGKGKVAKKAKKSSGDCGFYLTAIKKMGYKNVTHFQCSNDLEPDGKLGKNTKAKIDAIVKNEVAAKFITIEKEETTTTTTTTTPATK